MNKRVMILLTQIHLDHGITMMEQTDVDRQRKELEIRIHNQGRCTYPWRYILASQLSINEQILPLTPGCGVNTAKLTNIGLAMFCGCILAINKEFTPLTRKMRNEFHLTKKMMVDPVKDKRSHKDEKMKGARAIKEKMGMFHYLKLEANEKGKLESPISIHSFP